MRAINTAANTNAADWERLSRVYIVDDDPGVRKALEWLLSAASLKSISCASADEFLQRWDRSRPGCILLDIRMPGMNGLELQHRLGLEINAPPIVFISGHADVEIAVQAMKNGATGFLTKPFSDESVLNEVRKALRIEQAKHSEGRFRETLEARISLLTKRERQVIEHVVQGESSKQIAINLGISQKTVELHRSKIMRKLRARSVVDIVRDYLIAKGDVQAQLS